MDISKINLNMSQNYLEMARAYLGIPIEGGRPVEQIVTDDGIDPYAGMLFSITSSVILYSYHSIEAFANYQLYKIWEAAKIAHQFYEKKPELLETSHPLYDKFYNRYIENGNFEDLKNTKLRDLPKRLKVLCEELEIRKIHEVNVQLWEDFLHILKDLRDFLVHPFPDPKEFSRIAKKIMMEVPLQKYVDIAQETIKHFYSEKNHQIPQWLETNTIFVSKGFQYFYG